MPPQSARDPSQMLSQKRKDPPAGQRDGRDSSANKRPRLGNTHHNMLGRRDIPSQAAIAGLDRATGALNVSAFVAARQFEIKALEKAMQRDRKGLSQRAFQQVPRNMRRRGASHNAKKVPKRLRKRAVREMKDDNTPTVNAKTRVRSRLTRIRMERAKRLVGINARLRAEEGDKKRRKRKKKEAEKEKEEGGDGVLDPENMVKISRIPKVKKNVVSKLPKATSKFKKRQVHKAWLPTHLWHAKRAHMTRPTEPLWRMAIPLEPTEKSYRPTHRASGARGAVAWDMSYISTISCSGTQEGLERLLKKLAFGSDSQDDIWGKKGSKWRNGTRAATAWLMDEDDGYPKAIAPVTVLWLTTSSVLAGATESATKQSQGQIGLESGEAPSDTNRSIFIRVHPSAFLQIWTAVLAHAKKQNPPVMVEDLRFEIGSIEITGPASTEALQGVLKPVSEDISSLTWTKLKGLTNPASLPLNAILSFDVLDSRLLPRFESSSSGPAQNIDGDVETAQLLATWPPDIGSRPAGIFSKTIRYAAEKALPSQKSINRRKLLAPPGTAPTPKDGDPSIPVMLLASRDLCQTSTNGQGKWTVLLPWRCVDVVWRQLLYYPLSSGSTSRFGGLKQQQQIAFERQLGWFPGDFAGTEAGKAWMRTEDGHRKKLWERKPPSRRVKWEALDFGNGETGELGQGWSCDWMGLLKIDNSPWNTFQQDGKTSDDGSPKQDVEINTPFRQLTHTEATTLLRKTTLTQQAQSQPFALIPIRLTYLSRGTPKPPARVYLLPKPGELREKWLKLDERFDPALQGQCPKNLRKDPENHWGQPRKHYTYPTEKIEDLYVPGYDPAWDEEDKKKSKSRPRPKTLPEPDAESRAKLASSLLNGVERDVDNHPPCPSKDRLVGFVTSGAFNLAEGRGTAVGSIWAQKVVDDWQQQLLLIKSEDVKTKKKFDRQKNLVVVRNAGETVGRLASWELI